MKIKNCNRLFGKFLLSVENENMSKNNLEIDRIKTAGVIKFSKFKKTWSKLGNKWQSFNFLVYLFFLWDFESHWQYTFYFNDWFKDMQT